MNPISKFVWNLSRNARQKRAKLFLSYFEINEDTKVLDLGSENGTNIFNVLQGTPFRPENIFIADIDDKCLKEGRSLYDFEIIQINESGRLPFPDKFFDVVYCSSVIEHVTLPKADLWSYKDGKDFAQKALASQALFANEIKRLGKKYFVQTPCRSFPIESHTWLPFVGYFPRRLFLPILRLSNRYWVKAAAPDFNLLGKNEMQAMFPDAQMITEKKFGLTKSIMMINS